MSHDIFQIREVNNIDLGGGGGERGYLILRCAFARFVTRVLARIVAKGNIGSLNSVKISDLP